MSELKNNSQQVMMPSYYMQKQYEEDDINLVDLWIVLLKYKMLFFCAFFAFLVAGALFVWGGDQKRYELTSTIQVGTIQVGSDDMGITGVPIESPESLLSKISNAIEPFYTAEWKDKHKYSGGTKIDVSNPKGSNIIILKNKVEPNDVELLTKYQQGLLQEILKDHDEIVKGLQAPLRSELGIAALKLTELENPLFLTINLKELEIKADAEKFKLKKLQGKNFSSNELEIEQQQLVVDSAVLNVEKKRFDIVNAIALQQKRVEVLQTRLDSYNKTRVLSAPILSEKPAGLSHKVVMVLVVLMAGFLSFLLMLIVIFSDKVKQRKLELANGDTAE